MKFADSFFIAIVRIYQIFNSLISRSHFRLPSFFFNTPVVCIRAWRRSRQRRDYPLQIQRNHFSNAIKSNYAYANVIKAKNNNQSL